MNVMNERKSMNPAAAARALCLCGLLLATVSAQATPFSIVSTPMSGERGSTFTSALFDDGVDNLEAADIRFTFDSDVFSYLGVTVGSATGGFFLLAGMPLDVGGSLRQVEISLATGGDPVDGLAGSLVDVSFMIKATAPLGDSELVFESRLLSDYVIPRTTGQVSVLPGEGVPEPGSVFLVGLAMLAMAGLRRAARQRVTRLLAVSAGRRRK